MNDAIIKVRCKVAFDANGGAFVRGARLSHETRDALRALAEACGVLDASAMSDLNLVALYGVAAKSPASARRTADKVNADAGTPTSLIDAPAPVQAGLTEEAATALVFSEAARILAPVNNSFDALRRDHIERCQRMQAELDAHNARSDEILARIMQDMADNVQTAVAKAVANQTPTVVNVVHADGTTVELGLTHYCTPRLLKWLTTNADPKKRLNVYLYGPAGSGKTSAVAQIAKALNVPFYFAAKIESEYLLLGFKDAMGTAVRTAFREAYENGGLFLFDEFDASASSAITALNAALANGFCPFPDGTIFKHPDFYCVAAGNTALKGATSEYNGRVALDGASVDRFTFMAFGYDEEMERAIAPDAGWCLHVQTVRRAVRERGYELLVTPRATLSGAELLSIGEPWREVEDAVIFKGIDEDTANAIRAAVGVL